MHRTPSILVADDHVLVAQAMERLLSWIGDVTTVHSAEALIVAVERKVPDVVVADVAMGDVSGLDALRTLRQRGYDVPFVILTMHADSALACAALESGAQAFVLKAAAGEVLVQAINVVLAGGTYVDASVVADTVRSLQCPSLSEPNALTEKQRQVLEYVARGWRSKQVAFELGVSVRTVESHKYALMRYFGVHTTLELLRVATAKGYFPTERFDGAMQSWHQTIH